MNALGNRCQTDAVKRWLGCVVVLVVALLLVAAWQRPDWFARFETPSDGPAISAAPTPEVVDPGTRVDGDIPDGANAATVNYVHDGDTLFLSTPSDSNLKVRLLAVDTPEIGDNLECFGNESTNFLRTLAPEGSTVYTVADVEPLDQYGRSLLFVYTASGELINLSLVQQGFAEAVFIGDNRMLEQQFEEAEDAAQQSAAGVWGNC